MSKRNRLADTADNTIGAYGHLRFSIFQAVAVYDVRLSTGDVRALAALGSHATAEHGYWCWPEVTTLSDRLGVTVRRVRQSIAALESCGYIEVCERYDPDDGRQLANGYRLIMDYELPDEYRRCNNERPRKGIGGRLSSGGRGNSEFRGEDELRVPPQDELRVPPQDELRVPPSESEKKKQRKETEKTRVRGASPSIAEKVVENAESAERTPPTPPTPSPAPSPSLRLLTTPASDEQLVNWREVSSLWQVIRYELPGISEAQRHTWLDGARLYRQGRHTGGFVLVTATRLQAEIIADRFAERIEQALDAHDDSGFDICLFVAVRPAVDQKAEARR